MADLDWILLRIPSAQLAIYTTCDTEDEHNPPDGPVDVQGPYHPLNSVGMTVCPESNIFIVLAGPFQYPNSSAKYLIGAQAVCL